ncbi:hypothetical protein [Arundinibacter roseus]|uniref:Uncharacterized protein n=1 Tax=Arundinibacter roseus TaxID=2070510 RepID=A0A4R4KCK9_9BACT|nr:hypothetical protein [Arundinibacter roseus]TDB64436.1 hypothetical protein EZE20_12190 [Arundinibacter roseus]
MNKRALPFFISLTLLLPIGIFFYVWNYYAINIPKWDDHALKAFLVEYIQASTFSEKLQALLRQHNEHRISLTRVFTLLDYILFDGLSFKRLMLYGNLLLIGILGLWGLLLHKNAKPYYTLLPVPFIWLTLAHYENMYWGMAAIQNFGVVVLAAWTLFCCISRSRNLFLLSLALAVITCLTSGNGLLVLPIGAVTLFLAPRWRRLLAWLVMSGVLLFGYFNWYTRSPANPEATFGVGKYIKGFLYFLGSFAESLPVNDHFFVCLLFGGILFLVAMSIISTTLFRIIRNRYEYDFAKITDLFCLGVLLFILGTTALVVYSRVGFGLEGLLTSRYKIYSFLLLLVAYLYIVIPIRGSFLSPYVSGIIFLNVLYSLFSNHYHLVDASNLRKFQTTQRFNWTYTDRSLKPFKDQRLAGKLVEDSPVFYQSWLPLLPQASQSQTAGDTAGIKTMFAATAIRQGTQSIDIQNNTYISNRLQDSGVYILLSSAERYYLFPTNRSRNTNRKQLLLHQQYFAPGFSSSIPFAEIKPGTYALGMVWQQGEKTGIVMGKDSIDSKQVLTKTIRTNW